MGSGIEMRCEERDVERVERWCLGAYLNVDVLAEAQVGTRLGIEAALP